MTQDKAAEARKGLADNLAGKAKEVAGMVSGKDNLIEEGQLQQAEARNRKEATAEHAIAEAMRAGAAQQLSESSREAQSKKDAARVAANQERADVEHQRDSEYAAANRDANLRERHGDQAAQAHGDQVAEAGLREAAALSEEADATEQQADAEKSRLEREAANAARDAAQLRAQAEK